jgi:hypothetical protein
MMKSAARPPPCSDDPLVPFLHCVSRSQCGELFHQFVQASLNPLDHNVAHS